MKQALYVNFFVFVVKHFINSVNIVLGGLYHSLKLELFLMILSLLDWGANAGGSQSCQQSTSMCFQALRSCAKVRISWGRGGGGGFSGLISFAAYSWNRILRPSGLGLPCVGWYRAYLEIRSPWLTDWEKGTDYMITYLTRLSFCCVWYVCCSTGPRKSESRLPSSHQTYGLLITAYLGLNIYPIFFLISLVSSYQKTLLIF